MSRSKEYVAVFCSFVKMQFFRIRNARSYAQSHVLSFWTRSSSLIGICSILVETFATPGMMIPNFQYHSVANDGIWQGSTVTFDWAIDSMRISKYLHSPICIRSPNVIHWGWDSCILCAMFKQLPAISNQHHCRARDFTHESVLH